MTHQDVHAPGPGPGPGSRHAAGEVPVGCVIVDKDGQVVGRGRNRREEEKNPLAHAELDAIADACRRYGDWRLKGCAGSTSPWSPAPCAPGDHRQRPHPRRSTTGAKDDEALGLLRVRC